MSRSTMKVLMIALLASISGAAGAAAKQRVAHEGELILFEHPNYAGDDYTTIKDQPYVDTPWNVGSIAIFAGEKWQICNRARYQGACITITDNVADASAIGVMGKIPSARRVVDKK